MPYFPFRTSNDSRDCSASCLHSANCFYSIANLWQPLSVPVASSDATCEGAAAAAIDLPFDFNGKGTTPLTLEDATAATAVDYKNLLERSSSLFL